MSQVQIYNKISELGLKKFPLDRYELGSEMTSPEAILLRSHILEKDQIPDSVLAIGRAGAGVNNIPIDYATENGVVVFNTPGANANAVKELVLAALLNSSRHLNQAAAYTKALNPSKEMHKEVENMKKQFKGTELKGKRFAVVGLGAIGLMVANAAVELGMDVYGYDPYLSVNRAWELSSAVKPAAGLESMLREADFVTVHMPYTEDTKHFFNETRLSYLKSSAVLLNFSREAIVDNQALIKALDLKQLKSYVSDFPCEALINREDVIMYPHLGASTHEAEDNCAVMIVDQIRDFLETGSIVNSVNFPTCVLPLKAHSKRLVIINKNIPTLISKITTLLANNDINIVELTNKSRNDIAYNLIDVQGDLSEDILVQLRSIESVISVRLIQTNC